MMSDFISYITLRTIFIFASTAFSILIVMLALNIITVDDVVAILKLSPEAANAFRLVVSRVQEVTGNILDIISQLLNKLLGWAGVDVDLNKIKIDVHQNNGGGSMPHPEPFNQNPAEGQ
jgi:hypothetical protein